MTPDEAWAAAQREWENPANWRGPDVLAVYVAPRDPRIIVRKRIFHHGWTLNYAHRASWVWTAGLFGAVAGLIASMVQLSD
jgi:uncharacterized membrane protein